MPEKQTNKEKLREITDRIEVGIKELFQSDKYAEYLRTMSRFHHYSVNNQVLIHMQKPDATLVAGFNRWRDQFGRNVIKGEKGIRIIAPTPYKKKVEREKLDPDTKLPMLDDDGNPIMEEKEVKIPMFRVVSVFDVSQTTGRPLPQLASDLKGDVQNYDAFIEAVKRSAPVPVSFEPMAVDMDGYFSIDKQRIAIREGMSEVQTVSAAVHEITHAKLHNYKEKEAVDNTERYEQVEIFDDSALFSNGRVDRDKLPDGLYCYDLRGSDYDPGMPIAVENHVGVNHAGSIITASPLEIPENERLMLTEDEGLNYVGGEATLREFYEKNCPDKVQKTRNTMEVEAESVSFAVCAYYGIETGDNSFGYIATWCKDRTLPELKASLETINKTADSLITDIDANFREVCKERGIDLSADEKTEDTISNVDAPAEDKEAAFDKSENNVSEKGPEPEGNQKVSIEPPVQEEAPKSAPENGYMPDPSMSIEAMNAYGYTDSDMLPLSKERAEELLEMDVPVYMLYDNNDSSMAFDSEDIKLFSGYLGVPAEEWDKVKDKVPPMDENLLRSKREQAFLAASESTYAIYQLKEIQENHDIRFEGLDQQNKQGITPDKERYDFVYSGLLPHEGSMSEKLEGLYQQFNLNRPQDFTGHSLSVSDIIAVNEGGRLSSYYVDRLGYSIVPDFFGKDAQNRNNPLKNAEMQMEDDYNQIDGIINNGPKEQPKEPGKPVQQPKKPSVLAKLRRYQAEDRKEKAQRSAEREL